MEEPVEPLPLLGRDLFAHLAGIFARAVHAKSHCRVIEIVEDQLVRHRLQIAVPVQARRLAQRSHKPLPALSVRSPRRCRASGPSSRRAGARCSPPAPGSGSSSRDCRQPAIASVSLSLSFTYSLHDLILLTPESTCPCCRRPARNSPPANLFQAPRASARRAQYSPCRQTECKAAGPHAAAPDDSPIRQGAREKSSVGCAM